MYLRFVVSRRRRLRSHVTGIFSAAYAAVDDPRISSSFANKLQETINWFEKYLPEPTEGAYPLGQGLTWFKPQAQAYINVLWELEHLLASIGWKPYRTYSRNPGHITYEDTFQIVAIPRFNCRPRQDEILPAL